MNIAMASAMNRSQTAWSSSGKELREAPLPALSAFVTAMHPSSGGKRAYAPADDETLHATWSSFAPRRDGADLHVQRRGSRASCRRGIVGPDPAGAAARARVVGERPRPFPGHPLAELRLRRAR